MSYGTITKPTTNLLDSVPAIFTHLSTVNPIKTSKILAEGYWAKGDGGGGIFYWDTVSDLPQDGGKIFSSPFSATGRWKRLSTRAVNVMEYGAQPLRKFVAGTAPDYSYGGEYPEKTLAQAPQLSTKFANLAAAQAWYPHVFSLDQTIDHAAIQEAIEQNSQIEIPEGSYLCRHSLKIIRKRRIMGASMRNTIIKFIDCAGIVPRTAFNSGDVSFVYSETTQLLNFTLVGNWVAGNAFDVTRSGINFPQNLPMQTYNENAPLGSLMLIENVEVRSFAGHGIQWMELFSTRFETCSSKHNAGHSFFTVGGNSLVFRNCYASEVADNRAGFRIFGHALLESCTGTDSVNAWWGHFGSTAAEDGFDAQCEVVLINCNLERQNKTVRIVSGGSFRMLGGAIQAHITAADPYMIFDEGYGTRITLSSVQLYSITALKAEAEIKNYGQNGLSGRYFFDRCIGDTTNQVWKSAHFNSSDANIFGTGTTIPASRLDITYPEYATFANSYPALHGNKLYFGGGANPCGILSGTGSPEGVIYAERGSLYSDRNTGSLYSKKTDGNSNTGWKNNDNTFTITKAAHGFPVPSVVCWDGAGYVAADKDTLSDNLVVVAATTDTFTIACDGIHVFDHGFGSTPGLLYLGDPPNNLTRTKPTSGEIILAQVLNNNTLWINPEQRPFN